MNNISKNLSRQEQILEIVKDKYRVSIDELAKKFNVTQMTIYRDLEFLENENKIIRTKKSATYITNQADIDYAYYKRLSFNKDEKQAIAKEALKYISNNELIYLDGSTSTFYLAKLIIKSKFSNLTIMTPSPVVIYELLKDPGIQILCPGGTLNMTTYLFYNENLDEYLKNININKIFISCSGFSINAGFTEALKVEASLKMSIIKKSNEVIFLADYSKSNIISAYTFASPNVADILITDSRVNKEFIKKLKEKIPEIIVAG
jgi:DeoR/GlpR family transcriptional regulator of sugar metabolism